MTSLLRLRRPAPGSTDTDNAGTKPGAASGPVRQRQDNVNTLNLMSLPTEIHLAVSQYLIYPDALSLKHTNRHFYCVVDTGTKLKVEWLLERRSLHLDCPNDRRCDLGSDLRFCRGSVPLLMKRRREHIECDSKPGLGCLIFGTKTCTHRKRQRLWRRWLNTKLTVELWWVLLAMVPVMWFWAWLVELVRGNTTGS